jgi:hypothetical protein
MGKKDVDASMEDEEEEHTVVLSPIANPLAKDKLVKKILKLVKAGENEHLARCLTYCAVGPCCVVGGGGSPVPPCWGPGSLACTSFSACMHAMACLFCPCSILSAHPGFPEPAK